MLRAASVVLVAASLAGGRSSIEHSDAVRRRLSQTPDLRRLQHSSDTCQRPSWGCDVSHDIYTNIDCDGDGILDHMCTTTINSNRWLVLSSEGCPQDWGTSSRAASECPTTGTFIPGTYSMVYTNGYTCTYTVTEDGKVEISDGAAGWGDGGDTHGWAGTAELSENDAGEYADYPHKITGGSTKWELARF